MMEYDRIAESTLFRGISPEEAASMLHCFQAVERVFPKGVLICRQGDPVTFAGLLLSGEVHILQNDLWGNASIFSHIGPGELFSEAYAAKPGTLSLVNAVAAQESRVLLLSIPRILSACPNACAHIGAESDAHAYPYAYTKAFAYTGPYTNDCPNAEANAHTGTYTGAHAGAYARAA